ncbi:MAG: thioredoxin-disulfide reductase [Eubacteriales bacterium]|nr:thioredoxin-disulfide reductase [Eubacteriales bacterium]
MSEIYDLLILGAGPAGISAAIYAARAGLNTLWLDKQFVPGGQIVNTYEVDNYPGMPGMSGIDLGEAMGTHAEKMGISPVGENVLSVEDTGTEKLVYTNKHEYRCRTLLLACGATHRKLNIPGEEELSGMGVSYCATCDGAFFKDRTTVVVGGGNTAAEDAIFLARVCRKVYVVHRRNELRADKILQDRLAACENIEMVWDSIPLEIRGTDQVTGLLVRNVKTGEESLLETDGVFIAVGILPNTDKFRNFVQLDENGYIVAGEEGVTSTPGVFAAGDIRTKSLRQVVTAVSDGANAVNSVQKYLLKQN